MKKNKTREPTTFQEMFDECDGSTAYSNDRDRPYDGQPHTDNGKRGATKVQGLTIRDITDCFIKGFLLSNGIDQPELYERVENGSWLHADIFKIDLENIDPIAALQNMSCEIEKMMGIFPNVDKLKSNDGQG